MTENNILDKIFKAYDIRGIYPGEINEGIVAKIAYAMVQFLKPKKIVLAQDARVSSKPLVESIQNSLVGLGVDVILIGQTTTPLFYFAVNELNVDGGIMVTASHNPRKFNGLKMVKMGAVAIGGNNGLMEIKQIIKDGLPDMSYEPPGKLKKKDLSEEYIDFLITNSWFKSLKINQYGEISWEPNPYTFKAVVDSGNGMAGFLLPRLFEKIKFEITPLFWEIDGSFPNRDPDPTKLENLSALQSKVLKEGADLGVAFDGDADRIMFLDRFGNFIRTDCIGLLLAQQFNLPLVKESKSAKRIVYDLTMSHSIPEFLDQWGIASVKSRVGHPFLKQKMRETDADMAVELSGHYFWKEMNYAESTLLTMLRIFSILAKTQKPLDQLVKPFQKYYHSGEINFEIDKLNQVEIFNELKIRYKDAKIDDLDGLTFDYWDLLTSFDLTQDRPLGSSWWFNVRPSNTEPILRLVVEAGTESLMKEKIVEIQEIIKKTRLNAG